MQNADTADMMGVDSQIQQTARIHKASMITEIKRNVLVCFDKTKYKRPSMWFGGVMVSTLELRLNG